MFGDFFLYEAARLVLQQQFMLRNCQRFTSVSPSFHLRCKSALPSLFLRYCSITCPSLLHRCSIVSMDNRWIIDGLLMDYLRRKSINTIAR